MSIERADIEKLAELARIGITDDTIAETTRSLGDVLALVDQLQAADTNGVEPMAHPLDAVQRLRADTVSEPDCREAMQTIAPATENGLFLVPKVIE
jgi:aspartyl-tRNA(Asn)/glutamyl-tRNA(Gln) amidotransferase subunit C